MSHTYLAYSAAVLGALSGFAVLLGRKREILAGFVALALAEVGLLVALVPGHDLKILVTSPMRAAALVGGVIVIAGLAFLFEREPGIAPVLLVLAAPFRIGITLGSQHARLLLPLYAVLAAAGLTFAWRLLHGNSPRPVARALAAPSAALIALYAVSLLWAKDTRAGTIELAAFLFPFLVLVVIVVNEPRKPWLLRALVVSLVGEAVVFAAFGLWEEAAHRVFFSRFLEVANIYSGYFRTNSFFYDPNIYGRFLVLALSALVVLMWRRRLSLLVSAALIAFIWVGLYFAYSLSSLVALFFVSLGVALVLGGRRTRRTVAVGAASMALIGVGLLAVNVHGHSLRNVTSGRSRLASVAFDVFRDHPLVGVGVGSQPLASQQLSELRGKTKKDTSHTTPLTVAAELGIVGVAAYLAWLSGALVVLRDIWKREQTLGLALIAVFGALFIHSLSYSDFFEDPITWGALALAAAFAAGASPGKKPPEGSGGIRGWKAKLPPWVGRKVFLIPFGAGMLIIVAGLGTSLALHFRSPGVGKSITSFTGLTVSTPTVTEHSRPAHKPPAKKKAKTASELCWNNFGGDQERSLSRPTVNLGRPTKLVWTKGLHDLMEYPPSYCNGRLYVNLEEGRTLAINAENGHVIWSRKAPGFTASTPAIAGPRLFVSSHGGTVTAFRRSDGALLWRLKTNAPVESSPVAVRGVVYVGAADGKLYALRARTGKPVWIYDTGGRISSSPSVVGGHVCITTYSGLIACLRRGNGHLVWAVTVRRDFVSYDSFYASPSSDGRRIFTVSRSGKVLALAVSSGRILWTYNLGETAYGTPSIADGRVFVADLAGDLHAFKTTNGALLWQLHVPGEILGPSIVVGKLVFFSTQQGDTYAARTDDGRIVWQIGMGKFSPGIATDKHYYFSFNGRLAVFDGRYSKR
jgi:putative inorganic carbon (HCO3(-)) transporter